MMPPIFLSAPVQLAPSPTSSLRQIIDKKVNMAALSCFERFSHSFLTTFSCFYPSYKIAFQKAARQAAIARSMAEMQTTHRFLDGTLLLDRTKWRIASISPSNNSIFLEGKEVFFSTVMKNHFLKVRDYNVEVAIEEVVDRPGVFRIVEREAAHGEALQQWMVDTNKIFFHFRSGSGSGKRESVHIVEEEIEQGIDLNYFQIAEQI